MTKRVRMLTSIAGDRWSARKGSEVTLDAAEAGRLIAAGYAVPVDTDVEEAVAPPKAERAVAPRQRKRA